MMRIRSLVIAAGCGLAITAASGATAFAGEVNGQQQPIPAPEHANSICVYSGQNNFNEQTEPGRTQSYGQIVAAGGKAYVPSPGVACNGHLNPWQGGGVPVQ